MDVLRLAVLIAEELFWRFDRRSDKPQGFDVVVSNRGFSYYGTLDQHGLNLESGSYYIYVPKKKMSIGFHLRERVDASA